MSRLPEVLLEGGGEPVHALLVGHVELAGDDVAGDPFRRRPALLLIPGAHDDREASLGELAADLQSQPPVSPANQRDPRVLRHATSDLYD